MSSFRCVALPALLIACAVASPAAERIRMTLHTVEGTGDAAMYVAWLETTDGRFVRTLTMYSHDKKYFKDMTLWQKSRAGTESGDPPDAMLSPTLKWNAERTVEVPRMLGGVDLLAGTYVIRVEQRKDKGGHYKKVKIPLPADFSGTTVQDQGYLSSLAVSVVKE